MIEYAKIQQRQDSLSNLTAVIRDKFLAYNLDSDHLVYSKDGLGWVSFYNSGEVDSKLAQKLDGTGAIDASQVTSGTFDVARIPVLPSQVQITSSGDLTALTAGQQAQIGQGSIITTTDGTRWVYSGTGSKTLAASYIVLADITPDWSVISNRPTNVSTWSNDAAYIALGSPLTGFAVGANSSILAADSLLAALGKVQGQVNNRQGLNSILTSVSGLSTSSTGLVKLTSGVASFDSTAYLSTASAASTYATISSLASYLTTATAATTYQPLKSVLTSMGNLSTASTGLVKLTNGVASFDSSTYLTANQTITLTGEVTGSGTTSIATTVAQLKGKALPTLATGHLAYNGSAWIFDNTAYLPQTATITAGGPIGSSSLVPIITYNAYGQLTTVSSATITPASIGAVSASGGTYAQDYVFRTGTFTTLKCTGIGAGFVKGLADGTLTWTILAASDITTALGYTPVNLGTTMTFGATSGTVPAWRHIATINIASNYDSHEIHYSNSFWGLQFSTNAKIQIEAERVSGTDAARVSVIGQMYNCDYQYYLDTTNHKVEIYFRRYGGNSFQQCVMSIKQSSNSSLITLDTTTAPVYSQPTVTSIIPSIYINESDAGIAGNVWTVQGVAQMGKASTGSAVWFGRNGFNSGTPNWYGFNQYDDGGLLMGCPTALSIKMLVGGTERLQVGSGGLTVTGNITIPANVSNNGVEFNYGSYPAKVGVVSNGANQWFNGSVVGDMFIRASAGNSLLLGGTNTAGNLTATLALGQNTATINGSLTVTGNVSFPSGSLTASVINGNTQFNNNLQVNGNIDIWGSSTFRSSISGTSGSFSGSLSCNNTFTPHYITITGSTYTLPVVAPGQKVTLVFDASSVTVTANSSQTIDFRLATGAMSSATVSTTVGTSGYFGTGPYDRASTAVLIGCNSNRARLIF